MSSLAAGARVVLKSGGPIMTISWVDGEEAYCQWFANNKLEGSTFRLTSLEISAAEATKGNARG